MKGHTDGQMAQEWCRMGQRDIKKDGRDEGRYMANAADGWTTNRDKEREAKWSKRPKERN